MSEIKRKRGGPKGSKSGYTSSEKTLAQRRKVSPITNIKHYAPLEGEDREYNTRQIDHIMKIHEISMTVDRNDVESLKSAFINYLILCQKDGFKVGNMAACAAMGISCHQLDGWIKQNKPGFKELALFVKETCSVFRESLIADQKLNPVIGIFWQRNYDGLRNDTEQQQSLQEMNDNDNASISDYRKKYGNLIDD